LFLGASVAPCLDAADVDDSGALDIGDRVYSLMFQFLGGAAPRAPFPDCGVDEPACALDCGDYPPCK
jgi:hypothetical protein